MFEVLLDRYEVLGQLGSGGLAEILRVRDRAVPGRTVALKRQHAHGRSGELLAEFLALADLQHPNLPAIYDYHDDLGDSRPGYTLEEVAGDTADRVVDRLGGEAVPDVAAGLFRALAHIHARGMAHGDLHPHNLIVDAPAGGPLRVKVLDLSPGVPRSGGMGALPYLAPERLEGQPPSAAADLYSAGVTLYRLLTGRLPYPDYPQLPPGGVPAGAGELGGLRDLVLSLLARRPSERPGRASTVLSRLAALVRRDLPLLTPEIVRESLLRGPTLSFGTWPAGLTDTISRDVLDRGEASVLVLTGPLGSGRSRALRSSKWSLQARGDTLVLATSAATGDPPAGAIRRLLTQVPPEQRDALPSDQRAAIAELHDGTLLHSESAWDPEKVRALATDRLARALLGLGRRRKLAVLVDDVDVMDPLGLDILRAAARYVAHRPQDVGSVALLLAVAPGSVSDMLLADAAAAARPLAPPPFDAQAMAGLLQATFLGRAPTHRLVGAVSAASGGNPLVAGEAVSAAFRRGFLALGEEDVDIAPSAPLPLPVPRSAAEALTGRLEAVEAETWPLLSLMAAVPVPVPARLAAPALGVEKGEAGRRIEALRSGGVLRWEVEDGEARMAFAAPALAAEAARRSPPAEAVLRRLAALDDAGLSLAARLVCALAALDAGAGGTGRAEAVARELLGRGHAAEALVLLEKLGPGADGRLLGDAYTMLGRDEEALRAYQGLSPDEANRLMGILHIRRGRYVEALDGLEAARDPDALAWKAHAHMMQSQYDAALAACELARPEADELQAARLAYIVGLVHFYRGDYPSASESFERALRAWTAAGRLLDQAEVVNAIGLVHFRQSELGRALDRWEETLKLAARCGDRERTWKTLMNLATVNQERGEFGVAESRYREALSVAEALGHRSGVMKIAQNLGNLYRFLGELGQAVEHLQRSLDIALSDGNRYIECHNRCLLGEVAWLRDEPAEAVRELSAALAGFTEVGSVGEAADCRRSMAEVALLRDGPGPAAELAAAALKAGEETGLPRVEILARLTLAEVERRLPDGDLDRALALAEQAVAQLGSMERPDLRWQALHTVYRVRRDRGEAALALQSGLDALRALDELAASLPESRRATFLGVRNRREAVRELRWLQLLERSPGKRPERGGRLTRLLDVNQRLNAELDLDRLLEYIIDSAILLTGAERGFLLMREPSGSPEPLRVVVARNIDQENIRNKRHKVSYSIAQRVIESQEAVLTTDAMEDERYSEYLSIHHLKLRSVLCIPMVRRGEVLGALYIDNRFQRDAFTEDDLAFMEAFANQAAIALGNAKLLNERQSALSELAQSQREVEELNEQLQEQLRDKERALEETEQMLVVQRRQLRTNHGYESIVGDSPALRRMFHVLDRVCESEISVLVTGESGTGKELVAKAIHYNGPRKERSFVAINCSSIPETLIESELFGHVRGAFTGATSDKKGVFEVAHEGTLFLDEIGEMPLEMQAKLLRALQEGEIQKVGSPRAVKVDVRIIAATNRKLREVVRQKGFREDLYYRLAVVTIELPALRERVEDIPILTQHFIEKNTKDGLGRVQGITPEALRLLVRYTWPGNVRELETVVKNASIFAEANVLTPQDFSNFPSIVGESAGSVAAPCTSTIRPLSDLERDAIIHALEVHGGNKKKTAEQLGIDRRTLYNKLATYGISVERRAHVLDRD